MYLFIHNFFKGILAVNNYAEWFFKITGTENRMQLKL